MGSLTGTLTIYEGDGLGPDLLSNAEWTQIFNLHENIVDNITLSLAVPCRLIFPSSPSENTTFQPSTIGQKPSNIGSHGGPIFSPSPNQPTVGGNETSQTVTTYDFSMRVYYDVRDWIKVNVPVNISDGLVQTIGYMQDVPYILNAKYCIINTRVEPILQLQYVLEGEPIPHGFRMNKYFIAYWKRR